MTTNLPSRCFWFYQLCHFLFQILNYVWVYSFLMLSECLLNYCCYFISLSTLVIFLSYYFSRYNEGSATWKRFSYLAIVFSMQFNPICKSFVFLFSPRNLNHFIDQIWIFTSPVASFSSIVECLLDLTWRFLRAKLCRDLSPIFLVHLNASSHLFQLFIRKHNSHRNGLVLHDWILYMFYINDNGKYSAGLVPYCKFISFWIAKFMDFH